MTSKNNSVRLFIIALLFLLSGCAVKFIYNQLDWLIPWYLDDYVSLTLQQETLFESRLQQYLDWHRRQQLPIYADFLEWVAHSSEDGLNLSELDTIQTRSEKFTVELFARLAPALQVLFEDLDDGQVTELFRNLEKENKKYYEHYVERSEKKQRYKRVKDVRKFIERWTGNLTDEQVELIRNWSWKYQLMGKDFLHSRQAWQKQFQQVLKRRREHAYLERSLQDLFSNRRLGMSEEYNKKYQFNESLLKQLYLDLDASLSSEQRSRMIRKLKSYAQDFRELSVQ